MIRNVPNIMKYYGCSSETAQRYIDLREEGHPQHQALLMAGLADPYEENAKQVPMIATLFSMPGTLLFKSADGKWFYQNHANTWQSCPAFVSQDENAFAAAIRAQTGGEHG